MAICSVIQASAILPHNRQRSRQYDHLFMNNLTERGPDTAIPITVVPLAAAGSAVQSLPPMAQHWLRTVSPNLEQTGAYVVPDAEGGLARVLAVVPDDPSNWDYAGVAETLPPQIFYLDDVGPGIDVQEFAEGWALSNYRFDRYRRARQKDHAVLVWPELCQRGRVERLVESRFFARDLINMPANELSPSRLADMATDLASTHDAEIEVTQGQALLDRNFPLIHAVGRGSVNAPLLIDLVWGQADHPKLTLVGKGICYDAGGLNLKDGKGLANKKKDMAGAAQMMALAKAVMMAEWPLRLRLLIPAAENSISGSSYRPSDVLQSRHGLTVEVIDTDAEGRLVLADALTEACSEEPDLIIDSATLTGMQVIATGQDIPAYFTNRHDLSDRFRDIGSRLKDVVWPLPLFQDYRNELESPIADLRNVGLSNAGGAIHAALFLQRFLTSDVPWIHVDFAGWNTTSRPGRPVGGDVPGLHALLGLIEAYFSLGKPAANPDRSATD